MRCENCGGEGTDKHHIKTRGAGGPDEDWNLILLCRKCHSEVHTIGILTMLQKYPLLDKRLYNKGWCRLLSKLWHPKLMKNGE